MIRHIVMFKVKEENKASICSDIKQQLASLPNKISHIKHFEIGINEKESDRAYDMVLNSSFDSWEDLSTYANHEAHLEVVAFIKQHCDKTRVVDFTDE